MIPVPIKLKKPRLEKREVNGKLKLCRVSKRDRTSKFITRLGKEAATKAYKTRMSWLRSAINSFDKIIDAYQRNIPFTEADRQQVNSWKKSKKNALNKYNHYQQLLRKLQPGSVWATRKPE